VTSSRLKIGPISTGDSIGRNIDGHLRDGYIGNTEAKW